MTIVRKKIVLLLIISVGLIIFSCKNDNSFFINKKLEKMTLNFYKDIDGIGFVNPSCSYIIVEISKQDNYYKIVFSISNPSSFDNLYAVIKTNDKTIMIYSESDISELVYAKEPYNPDTKGIEITDYSFIQEDVYYENYYFDGNEFLTDTIF